MNATELILHSMSRTFTIVCYIVNFLVYNRIQLLCKGLENYLFEFVTCDTITIYLQIREYKEAKIVLCLNKLLYFNIYELYKFILI